jgi:colanic acid/amylovoran biosynthesis glycosyltransferase
MTSPLTPPVRRRVVCVTAAFPAPSETFITAKVLGLLRRGWDLHVVCWSSDVGLLGHLPKADRDLLAGRLHVRRPSPVPLARDLAGGMATLARDPAGRSWLHQAWRDGGWRRLAHSLKPANTTIWQLAPDLVHFEFGGLAVEAERLHSTGSTKLVSFRGFDLNYLGLGSDGFYDPVWQHADAVHVLGSDLGRRLRERGCPPDVEVFVIPPGVDVEFFDGRGPEPSAGPLRITTVARLHWKKGLEFGLRAVRDLLAHGVEVEYQIAGSGPYEPAVRAAVRELGLEPVVRLLGHLDRPAVRDLLRHTDVVLQPSVSEGFCNAVLEAQAMRVPVVCTDADGLGENVADGRTGLVVRRRDVAAMTGALLELAGDPAKRLELGHEGRRRACEHFSLDRHLDRVEAMYAALVAPDPSPLTS